MVYEYSAIPTGDTNMLMTSLAEIKSFNPCLSSWKDIVKGQSDPVTGEYNLEKQFPLVDCVESNSIRDVCWLLGKRKVEIQICVRFARMCVDSIKHVNNYNSIYAAASYAAAAQREKNKQFLTQCITKYGSV
jgi:hypothetical protein